MKKLLVVLAVLAGIVLSGCIVGDKMSFTPVKRTSGTDYENIEDPGICVSGGKVYMAYGHTEYFVGEQELWTAVMDEDGSNFVETKRRTFPDATAWSGRNVQIQVVGTKVYLAWVEYITGASFNPEVFTATMNIDGSGWVATQRTSDGITKLEVRMQVSGDKIYLVYGYLGMKFDIVSMDLDGSNWTVLKTYALSGPSWSGVRFQVVGSTLYLFWREADAAGEIDTFYVATMNTDGSSWDAQSVHTVDHSAYHAGALYGWTAYHRMSVNGDYIYLSWLEYEGNYPDAVHTLWTGKIGTDKTGFTATQRYYDADKDVYELEMKIVDSKIYYITRWEDPDVFLQGPICTATMNLDGSGFELIERTNTTDERGDVDLAVGAETIQYIFNELDGSGIAQVWTAFVEREITDKEAPWKEDTLEPTGEVKVEIPRRSGEWTTLEDVMRIHTSNGKDTSSSRAPIEIGQAEVTCSNISRNFNSFEEASDWYKNLEGYALQISVGCKIGGSPISVKLFTGIISSVDVDRLSQTAEIRVVDFLDYFGRVTIEETPVWEGISLTQLFKNLVQLAFPEWMEGTDYFVEDLGGSTIPAIGYTDLNLLSELKMIAESRGMRLYTDTSGRLHCASRNPEREPLTVKHDYNLEDVTERRDIDTVLNWVVVHARPHEILPDTTPPGRIAGFTATPGDNKIDLSWSNPTDDDFEKVLIRYSTTAYPLNRDDGTQIYEGTGEAKEHAGLTNGQRYYYSAWTKDTVGNWSDAAQTSAVAGVGGDEWADDTGTSRVSMFDAEPQSQKMILTWYNPNIANFDKVVIRRSTTGYPDSPTSGSSVYEGTAETTTDTGLANATRYYYSAFVKNTAGDYSGAAFASAETPSIIRTREMIQSQNITGYGILGPQTGAYGTSYSKKVLLRFGGLGGKYSTDWLRFKHQWDIKVNSGPKYSSNQRHEYGVEDDLGLGFTKNIGGVAGVTVTKVRVTTSEVQVEYKLVYIGGKALSISFSNKLSLWG